MLFNSLHFLYNCNIAVVCFVRHNRDNDFRASGSGKIDYDINKIPLEAVKIAHTISKENNFQSMAYDFLMNINNEVVLNEICYCYQSKAVYDCSGFWDRELNWHEGHVYPEAAHVEDFITLIETGKLV